MLLRRSDVLNNGRITPFSQWSNNSYIRSNLRGLALIGDDESIMPSQDTITKANAEAAYLVNLARGAAGKAPLPVSQTAPSVNVGIEPATLTALGIGGLLALLAFMRSRKKR